MSDSQTQINEKFKIIENLNIQLYRESKDTKTNARGYTLIDICRSNYLFILNGRYGEDKNVGQFPFRDKAVIDYVMATAQCFRLLHNFSITDTDNLFSDGHALLKWSLKSPFLHDKPPIPEKDKNEPRTRWDETLSEKSVQNISDRKLDEISNQIQSPSPTPDNIDNITQKITNLLNDSAKITFGKKYYQMTKSRQPWFGKQCQCSRKRYHAAKANYRKFKTRGYKINLGIASKDYKKTMKYYINKHKHNTANKLRKMQSNNPKKYWKLLRKNKKSKENKSVTPNIDDFYKHFQTVNSKSEGINETTQDLDFD